MTARPTRACAADRRRRAPASSGWAASSPTTSSPTTTSRQRMDTNDQWIRERVGIQSRRIADDGTSAGRHGRRGRAPGRSRTPGSRPADDRHRASSPPARCPTRSRTPPRRPPSGSASRRPRAFDLNAACAGFCYGDGHGRRPGARRHARATCWSSAPRSCRTGWTGPTARPRSSSPTARAPRWSAPPPTRPRSGSARWPGAARATWPRPSGSRPRPTRCTRRARRSSAGPPPRSPRSRCGPSSWPGSPPPTSTCSCRTRPTCASSRRWPSGCAAKGAREDMRVADDIVALRQHLVGVGAAGAGPHARRRAACAPATPCCS